MNRRAFIQNMAAAVSALPLAGQETSRGEWGGPVVDCHHHLRRTPEANVAHLNGSGISHAMVLARDNSAEQITAIKTQYPGRILGWFASSDITKPEAEELLTKAVGTGAIGFGELKSHVAAAGPELRRVYALAAELSVPVLIHFQEVPHTPTEGTFATGFKDFEVVLKAYPKTRFVGHADAFWANVSADYANESAYPTGKIKRGGITDKLLGDYPNLFADLSANSGNNALSRDPEFTGEFLKRHESKLIFGSDCACSDGNGGGVSQGNNPGAARLAGKCVARETLTLLRNTVSPASFRKLTWENAHRIYKLSAV
ncbi:MAG TPA: amidohydrolase family protein [Bryobacteraceae bacterium]|nr:amidohydrolase family protein [Bryobacteraceae bacterium]